MARTRYAPAGVPGAGLTSNRTVCDSSGRDNLSGCSGGVAVHPFGISSVTTPSVAAGDPLTTVTRISRDAVTVGGGATGAGGGGGAGGGALRPPARGAAGAGAAGAAAVGRSEAAGTIATSGDTRTDSAGTTSRSDR